MTSSVLRGSIRRGALLSVAAAAAVTSVARTGQAADKGASKRSICNPVAKDYAQAQKEQAAGHLARAVELYSACAATTECGGLAPRCQARLQEARAQLPSVVPLVTDDTGNAYTEVQVKMDGTPLISRLDGMALPVAPGLHEFDFATDKGVFAKRKILVAEGQHYRPVEVHMPNPDGTPKVEPPPSTGASPMTGRPVDVTPSAQPSSEKPVPEETRPEPADRPAPKRGPGWLPYAVGGLGVASLGAGVLLTAWGKKDNDSLQGCQPNCFQSSVDHVRTLYLAADVAYGVGVAGLGTAAVLFLVRGSRAEAPPPPAAVKLDVQPTRSGALASLRGTF